MFDPCQMYDVINETKLTCAASSFDNSSIIKCNKFVYETFEFTETLTTKLNLVCDNESKRRLLGTLMMLGLLLGSLVGGRLPDRGHGPLLRPVAGAGWFNDWCFDLSPSTFTSLFLDPTAGFSQDYAELRPRNQTRTA